MLNNARLACGRSLDLSISGEYICYNSSYNTKYTLKTVQKRTRSAVETCDSAGQYGHFTRLQNPMSNEPFCVLNDLPPRLGQFLKAVFSDNVSAIKHHRWILLCRLFLGHRTCEYGMVPVLWR